MTRWLCVCLTTVALVGCSKVPSDDKTNPKPVEGTTATNKPEDPGTALSDTKAGEAKLLELSAQNAVNKALKVSLGNKVKADCTYYINPDFFGKKAVSAQAQIKNTSDKVMYYGYYVAFYDKDKNLIACSSFGGGQIPKLDPGKETFIGNLVEIPAAQIKRIASYQVTMLEDDKEFGK